VDARGGYANRALSWEVVAHHFMGQEGSPSDYDGGKEDIRGLVGLGENFGVRSHCGEYFHRCYKFAERFFGLEGGLECNEVVRMKNEVDQL